MPTTIYIFGNLKVFQATLVGLQMIFNPANNTDWAVGGSLFGVGPLVTIGLLFSLLHLATKGIWTQKLQIHHVGILLGLYAAMFVPKTNVTVQDIYTGQTVIVDNIPFGVAYPASIVSQLSYDAAVELGQAFQTTGATAPPTNIGQGFAEPLKEFLAVRHLYQQFVVSSPSLALYQQIFMQKCVGGMIAANANLYNTVYGSANLWGTSGTLLTLNNGGPAYVPNPGASASVIQVTFPTTTDTTVATGNLSGCTSSTGCTVSCASAASALSTSFTNWQNQASSVPTGCGAAFVNAQSRKNTDGSAPMATDCNGNNLASILANSGSNGSGFINQVVTACSLNAGLQGASTVFASTNENANVVMPDYCIIDANSLSQNQIENAGAASLFLKNMLPLMSVLQFLFIALAPLAAFTMVMAGAQGMGMFVKYIMFGLWTQSWLPVAALLNDYSQMTVQNALQNLITGHGATTVGTGITVGNLAAAMSNVMQQLSNVNMLLALTPVITMIVFTGSYMGMAQLAQDVGGEDKVGKNAELEAPSIGRQEKAFGVSAPGNASGGYMVTDGAYDGAGFSYGSALSSGVSAAEQRASTETNAYATSVGHQAQTAMSMMNQYGEKFGQTAAFSTTGGHELTSAFRTMHSFNKDTGVSSDQLASFAAMYKGQLDLGKDPEEAMSRVMQAANKAVNGLTGNEENKLASAIKNSEVQKAARELSSGESAKLITQASRESNVAKAETDSQSLNKQVADTKNAQTSAQDAIAKSNTLKQEASAQSSISGSEMVNQKALAATANSRGQVFNDAFARQIAMQAANPHEALAAYEAQYARLATHMRGPALAEAALTLAGASDKGNLGVALGQYVYGQGFGGNVPQTAQDLTNRVNAGYDATANAVTRGTNSLNPAATNAGNADKQVPGAVNQGLSNGQHVKAAATATTNANTPDSVYESGVASVNSNNVGGFSKQFQAIAQQVKDAPAMPVLQWGQKHPDEFVAALAAANAIGPLIPAAGAAIGMGAKNAWSALKNEFGPAAEEAEAAAAGAEGEGATLAAEFAGGAGGAETLATLAATAVGGAAAAFGVGVVGATAIGVGTAINYAPKMFGLNETVSDMLGRGADKLLNGNSDAAKTWQEGYNKAIQTPQYKATQAQIKTLTDSGMSIENPEVKSLMQSNAGLINQTVAEVRAAAQGTPATPGSAAMPGI